MAWYNYPIMGNPFETRLPELVEKREEAYAPREMALLRRMFPGLSEKSPEAKSENALEDARRSLLRRLIARFDQRDMASLEAQGLNYFSVKNLREQIRRQDGRRVGLMASTDFGVEVFVPMSNVRVAPGDLRQIDKLEMRLQASHSSDRVVGIIERANPFRARG